jgi:hypothetical protein
MGLDLESVRHLGTETGEYPTDLEVREGNTARMSDQQPNKLLCQARVGIGLLPSGSLAPMSGLVRKVTKTSS